MEESLKGQVPIINENKQIIGLINFEIKDGIAVIMSLDGEANNLSIEFVKELVWQSLELYSLQHPEEMEIANPNRIRSFNISLSDNEQKNKTM